MRIRPGVLIAIVVVFGVLFGGRYFGWFGKPPAPAPPDEAPPTVVTTSPETPAPGPPSPTAALPTMPTPPRPPVAGGTSRTPLPSAAVDPATPPAPAGLITDWEQRIDDVLTGKEDEGLKAKKLLDIFPHLPEDGQVEAAQHLSNLLPDEQYPALAQTLTNAHTPEAVLDVLMTDVLNRPNPVKLNTLLDVARTPDHPKAEEAKDVLEVFVDEDYGQNWIAWADAIQRWLRENPEE